ncbi:MAG: metallophosphoesterase [Eubacteriales bacterium]|nr:metallophosphoesterase [Eubacteriales bacterium]
MKKFRTQKYRIKSKKILPGTTIKIAMIADLHGKSFGNKNEILLSAISEFHPEMVMIAGDMIVRYQTETEVAALELLEQMSDFYPVYYSMGNHESKMFSNNQNPDRSEFEMSIDRLNINVLRNESMTASVKKQKIMISGLELPLSYYKKPNPPKLSLNEMNEILEHADSVDDDVYHILLAHTPRYMDTYFAWGADLVLSGHYHGGVVRFSENHGVISPQFEIFPKYCCGFFENREQHAIVSAGLGVHSIPLRIHNPAELILITLFNE